MIDCPYCHQSFQVNPKTSGYMSQSVSWHCKDCCDYSNPTSLANTARVLPNIELLNNQVVFYYLPWKVNEQWYCLRGDLVGNSTSIINVTDPTKYVNVFTSAFFQPPIDNILTSLFKYFNKVQVLKAFS
jgi:hypothetical protein